MSTAIPHRFICNMKRLGGSRRSGVRACRAAATGLSGPFRLRVKPTIIRPACGISSRVRSVMREAGFLKGLEARISNIGLDERARGLLKETWPVIAAVPGAGDRQLRGPRPGSCRTSPRPSETR